MLETFKSYAVFKTPQFAVIRDWKLAVMEHLLNVAILVYVVWMIAANPRSHESIYSPSGAFQFWADVGDMPTKQAEFLNGTIPNYCTDRNYWYSDMPPEDNPWTYLKYECIANMGFAHMHEKGESQLFIMTYFDDTNFWEGPCEQITANCTAYDWYTHHTWKLSDLGGGRCKCSKKQAYYPVGAEEMSFVLRHSMWLFHKGHTSYEFDQNDMPTHIVKPDGSIYKTLDPSEAMSVKEWLQIVDTDIDDVNPGTDPSYEQPFICGFDSYDENTGQYLENLLGGPCAEQKGAHYRTTGVTLNLELNFEGRKNKAEAYIRVSKADGWHSMGSKLIYYGPEYMPTGWEQDDASSSEITHYMDRYRYGVKIRFSVQGEISRFNPFVLQNSIVAGIAYLSVIPVIVLLVAKYMCKHSDIYSKHIDNEGDVELQVKERAQKSFALHNAAKMVSPTKEVNREIEKSAWEEIVRSVGIDVSPDDFEDLWPFDKNVATKQQMILESEKNPKSKFSHAFRQVLSHSELIGRYLTINISHYEQASGVYELNPEICFFDKQRVYRQHHGQSEFWYNPRMKKYVLRITESQHKFGSLQAEYQLKTSMFPFGKNRFTGKSALNAVDVEIHTKITKEATMDFLMMIFHEFDDDGNHVLQKHEFKNLAQTWCPDMKESEIETTWEKMDKSKLGAVTITEMLDTLNPDSKEHSKFQGLSTLFESADKVRNSFHTVQKDVPVHDVKLIPQPKVPPPKESLPDGWEAKIAPSGRIYYINHKTKSTTWEQPLPAMLYLDGLA